MSKIVQITDNERALPVSASSIGLGALENQPRSTDYEDPFEYYATGATVESKRQAEESLKKSFRMYSIWCNANGSIANHNVGGTAIQFPVRTGVGTWYWTSTGLFPINVSTLEPRDNSVIILRPRSEYPASDKVFGNIVFINSDEASIVLTSQVTAARIDTDFYLTILLA